MKKILQITILLSAIIALHCEAQSLAECLAFAREHSLSLKVSDIEIQRSRQMEKTYFDIEKAELSLGQDPTSGGSPDNALTLSQKIDFPTVYTNRKRLLQKETNISEAQRQLTLSELTRDVSQAYSTLLLRHHEVMLLEHNDSILAKFEDIAAKRFKAGDINRLELINAERTRRDNANELTKALNEERSAMFELQALMNTEEPISPTDSYLCIQSYSENYSFDDTPTGMILQGERLRNEQELRLTKQEYLPSFSLGLRHQLVISGINPYGVDRSRFEKGGWMGFEVGVSVPLFFGSQRAKTRAAKYNVSLAELRREEAERRTSTQLLVATNNQLTAQTSYLYYQHTALPEAAEMRRLSQIEYEAGEITYLEHIQNLSAALDTELAAAQATDLLNQATINLNFIKGQQ